MPSLSTHATNILRYAILGTLALTLWGFASFANAQVVGENCTVNGQPGRNVEIEGVVTCFPLPNTAASGATQPTKPPASAFSCVSWSAGIVVNPSGCMNNLASGALTVSGLLLHLSGTLFDNVLLLSVERFSLLVENIPAVTSAWTVLRDAGNILILFVLLFSAIGVILRTDVLVSRGTLVKIIIAALLINFSMFFAKVVIDVANIFTYAIYSELTAIGGGSLSAAVTDVIDPQEVYATIVKTGISGEDAGWLVFYQLITAAAITLFAASAFFTVALMLIVRIGVLLFLIITSPIGVIGGLIPKLKTYAEQWKTALIGQAFFAPIFLLFFLIALALMRSQDLKSVLSGITGDPGTGAAFLLASNLIIFILSIFFIFMGLGVARQTAGKMGSGVVKWVTGKASSIAATSAGWAGRNTLARGARALGEEYDRRMSALPADAYKRANRITLGAFSTIDQNIRGGFKSAETARYGGKVTLSDVEKRTAERVRGLSQVRRGGEEKAKIDAGFEAIQEAIRNDTYNSTMPVVADYMKAVSSMSDKELEQMLEERMDLLKDKHFAAALAPRHMDFINKYDNITAQDKAAIRTAREEGLVMFVDAAEATDKKNAASGTTTNVKEKEVSRIVSGKPKDVAKLPAKVLTNPDVAVTLKPNVLNQIAQEDTLSEKDRDAIRTVIENQATTPGNTNKVADKSAQWLNSPAGAIF